MKNIVSFETARRLKEAGFPQPEPEVGQVWVEPEGIAYVIALIRDTEFWGRYMNHVDRIDECDISEIKNDAFCPTATDILLDMPDGYRLTRVNRGMFLCTEEEPLLGTDGCKVNPAEAAALAWFKLHETNGKL